MLETRFTKLVGCTHPVQNAGMGLVSSVELAASVSNAGGLGMTGLPGMPAAALDAALGSLSSLTGGAFGVNFLIPVVDRESVELASARCRVVEFFWGDPDRSLVDLGHSGGALVLWQVGSAREAAAAVDAGCDAVIAQGEEAGGHIRGHLGLLPLLSDVLDAVGVPVLAAGGIGSARSVAAVLAAGADGVRIGTRFVAARESGAHDDYKKALVTATAEDSVRTGAFSVGCPLCPSTHGMLRSAIDAASELEGDVAGHVGGRALPRFGSSPPLAAAEGHVHAMAMYAGQSVGAVRGVQPAAEIVRELVEGAEQLLQRWTAQLS